MLSSWLLPRRTFLKSASASIALPFLDAMVPSNPVGRKKGKPPVRLGWFYIPQGAVMEHWKPKTTGKDFELPSILKSLEPVKNRILVISDLAAEHCKGQGAGHEPSTGGILTGYKCKHSEEPEAGGISIDQQAAKMIGDQTIVDALTMGIDPGHRGDHGYSGTYLSHMSWRSPGTPAAVEYTPKELFDRLFGGRTLRAPKWEEESKASTRKANTPAVNADDQIGFSILDMVREDARSLLGKLGSNDRAKMEGYLDGIRSIEKRLDLVEKENQESGSGASAKDKKTGKASSPPDLMIPKQAGRPALYADHVNLMLDILVMAFWSDTTRVGTFLYSYEKSGRSYPELGVSGSHHSISHHDDKKENLDKLVKINTHHMELFSRMLTNMSRIEEGDGTLLDNVALMYGSGIENSNKHNHDNLPMILAGGGGVNSGGHHLALGKKTPVCNLYLDMMAMAGLELEKFGDSTGRLLK